MKKFELTSETIVNALGVTLFRIKATVDIDRFGVKKGDLGGFIEKEDNLYGDAWVYGNAQVYGNAWVSGNAWVYGNADYCCFQSFGSAHRTTTAYRTKLGVSVRCGYFEGTLDEFIKQVKETHGESKYAREYLAVAEVVKIKFDLCDKKI